MKEILVHFSVHFHQTSQTRMNFQIARSMISSFLFSRRIRSRRILSRTTFFRTVRRCLTQSRLLLTVCILFFIAGRAFPQERADFDHAIHLAAKYIAENTNAEGRLAYERHPAVRMSPVRYNVLRHAGTIYAVRLYAQKYPEAPTFHAVQLRLAEYLLTHYLREISGGMYTIASKPEEESLPEPQAKLGAAGLALIGLSDLAAEGKADLKILRGLGDFLLFMQKKDGSFHSKYLYSVRDVDPEFHSLYYPGEAALGLLCLHDADPQEKWLLGAKRALLYLAELRKDQRPVREFDHWAMLATEKLLAKPENSLTSEEKARLVFHARQMAEKILPTQIREPGSPEDGSMGGNIRPCSNGTKMEGLAAIWNILREEDPRYAEEILNALERLGRFLAEAQIQDGPLRGGIPASADWRRPRKKPSRKEVVRIDNVQHIMSGWIQYEKIVERSESR